MQLSVFKRAMRWLAIGLAGGLLQAGCIRDVTKELDLLWAPEANLGFVHQSNLVKLFGPQILQFW